MRLLSVLAPFLHERELLFYVGLSLFSPVTIGFPDKTFSSVPPALVATTCNG